MARGADRRGAADIGGAVARFLRRRTGPGVGGSPVGGDGALPAGALCGEFEVVRVLGVGGFGVTYLARDTKLRRPVAVKEYFPGAWAARREAGAVGPRSSGHAADYRWGLARFLEEARMLARFDHRHIVRVHQVFEARGTAYLVTDYVEGRSMAAEMEAEVALPEARVRALLGAVADGLAEVHGAGLLHRDVKPSNVMLRADGMPVLIDFGAARQAFGRHSGSVAAVLTPGYAPIEQYVTEGGAADRQGPWTDVYALGAVAYAALSGRGGGGGAGRAASGRGGGGGRGQRSEVISAALVLPQIARLQAELERSHMATVSKEHELTQLQEQYQQMCKERELLLRTTEMYELDKRELQDEVRREEPAAPSLSPSSQLMPSFPPSFFTSLPPHHSPSLPPLSPFVTPSLLTTLPPYLLPSLPPSLLTSLPH